DLIVCILLHSHNAPPAICLHSGSAQDNLRQKHPVALRRIYDKTSVKLASLNWQRWTRAARTWNILTAQ
ncbi:hypothetical protein NDU88_007752, partial [Pleurodeles waltl]